MKFSLAKALLLAWTDGAAGLTVRVVVNSYWIFIPLSRRFSVLVIKHVPSLAFEVCFQTSLLE